MHSDWLRLCPIDLPPRPARLGQGLVGQSASLRFGCVSQSQNSQNLTARGISRYRGGEAPIPSLFSLRGAREHPSPLWRLQGGALCISQYLAEKSVSAFAASAEFLTSPGCPRSVFISSKLVIFWSVAGLAFGFGSKYWPNVF